MDEDNTVLQKNSTLVPMEQLIAHLPTTPPRGGEPKNILGGCPDSKTGNASTESHSSCSDWNQDTSLLVARSVIIQVPV